MTSLRWKGFPRVSFTTDKANWWRNLSTCAREDNFSKCSHKRDFGKGGDALSGSSSFKTWPATGFVASHRRRIDRSGLRSRRRIPAKHEGSQGLRRPDGALG